LKNFQKLSPVRMLTSRLTPLLIGAPSSVYTAATPDGRAVLFYEPHRRSVLREQAVILQSRAFRNLLEAITATRDLARTRGCGYRIFLLPTKEEIYNWLWMTDQHVESDYSPTAFTQSVIDHCKVTDIQCSDIGPKLRATSWKRYAENGDLLWWRDDTHWNTEGHRVVAEVVRSSIESQ
jgi:lysophospholipase L1-like esterase